MPVTLSGIVKTPVSLLQKENAEDSILVTLSGIAMLCKLVQLENTPFSRIERPLPMETDVKFVQCENAHSLMLVTESGIVTLVNPLQP